MGRAMVYSHCVPREDCWIGLGNISQRSVSSRHIFQMKPEMKIIFVSGYAEDAFKKNLPDGEVFGFLPKPFALKQLIAAVKEAIG